MIERVIIAPSYRLGEYAARFVLEVSPRSCIFVSLDSRGDTEKLHGLREMDHYWVDGRRLYSTPTMRENGYIARVILDAREVDPIYIDLL